MSKQLLDFSSKIIKFKISNTKELFHYNNNTKKVFVKMILNQSDFEFVKDKISQKKKITINIIFKCIFLSLFYFNVHRNINSKTSKCILIFNIISIFDEIIHLFIYFQRYLSFNTSFFLLFLYFNEIISIISTFILSLLVILKWKLHMNISFKVIIIDFIIVVLNSYIKQFNSSIVIESNTRRLPLLLIFGQYINIFLSISCNDLVNNCLFQLFFIINCIVLNYALINYYDNNYYFNHRTNRFDPSRVTLFFIFQFCILFQMIQAKEVKKNQINNEIISPNISSYTILANILLLLFINLILLSIDTPIYSEIENNNVWINQRIIRKKISLLLMAIANIMFIYAILHKYSPY